LERANREIGVPRLRSSKHKQPIMFGLSKTKWHWPDRLPFRRMWLIQFPHQFENPQ
jgi:hypothetical protein